MDIVLGMIAGAALHWLWSKWRRERRIQQNIDRLEADLGYHLAQLHDLAENTEDAELRYLLREAEHLTRDDEL